jgi:hypothetical protein
MNEVELFDALDALSGFTKDASGNPVELRIGARGAAVGTINAMPEATRKTFLAEWTRQRFLRPVQLEWVEGVGEDAATVALETLEAEGIKVPAGVVGGEK